MPSPLEIKDASNIETPVLLFDVTLANGTIERWSTHGVTVGSDAYSPRVLEHTAFDLRVGSDDGLDALSRVSLGLANADSYCSQIERQIGFKGAKLHARFIFMNLKTQTAASDPITLFSGVANPPEEIGEARVRLSFMNRLSPARQLMPQLRIQKRCPWVFPETAGQREEAVTGLERGKYSPFFRCGYSPDQPDGVGNLDGSVPFTECDYTRSSCEERGMFSTDSADRQTRRFGGIEFVPASILVRGTGESGFRTSDASANEARFNDFVPAIYGTCWYEPPVVFARGDGNLLRMEVLLGMGEIESVVKLLVNDVEIPVGVAGANMTGTGWFNVVTKGNRTGGFNLDFTDLAGQPLGDPYGSMAYASVVVPARLADGKKLPNVKVLAQGMRLSRFGTDGGYLDEAFSANPAWVLLDLLRRSGWENSELDLGEFARAAAHCDEIVETKDLLGNPIEVRRYESNLVLRRRRSLAEVLRGVRNAAGLYLTFGPNGQLQLKVESTIGVSQPSKPPGSNAETERFSGWPAYEFDEGSILRRANDEPALRMWSRPTADSPNRYSLEFQDAFNEYQQDSLSLVDVEDAERSGQEIAGSVPAIGVANFDQAARLIRLWLDKSIRGNTYVEFETSIKALHVRPGDLITLSFAKEGLVRQLFRVVRVQPKSNYATVGVTAQIHDEGWYLQPGFGSGGSRRQGAVGMGLPAPLVGTDVDDDGQPRFSVVETATETTAELEIGFRPPTHARNSAADIPLVGLSPSVETTGGTLPGARSFYYAVSALDAEGIESKLSFVVRATLTALADTNRVILRQLSFAPGTTSFCVYRGQNPQQLRRIATAIALTTQFEDAGLTAELLGPPDENYHHANFYWRLEVHPETAANQFSATTVGNTSLSMTPGAFDGMIVRITKGRGAGQERTIAANSPTAVAVTVGWETIPDATSHFLIAEAGWKLGAISESSPVRFSVPNRPGATVHIQGRAANVNGQEAPPELSPITRWQIIGFGGSGSADTDVPGEPSFALNPVGGGTVELSSVGFSSLDNTRTISGGTLTVHFWNELQETNSGIVATDVSAGATTLEVVADNPAVQFGDLLQIEAEVVRVENISVDRLTYAVERGAFETDAMIHEAGTPLYRLERKVFVAPFVRGFFGSPASGKYSHPIYEPNVRIACAEFYVTNSIGDGPVRRGNTTGTTFRGLRTLSGGQLCIQCEGSLAIGSSVAPILVVDRTHAVGQIFAVVAEAPTGGPVELEVRKNGDVYCSLSIEPGFQISGLEDGFGRPPLQAGDQLTVDIVNVPSSGAGTPGRDLTVLLQR